MKGIFGRSQWKVVLYSAREARQQDSPSSTNDKVIAPDRVGHSLFLQATADQGALKNLTFITWKQRSRLVLCCTGGWRTEHRRRSRTLKSKVPYLLPHGPPTRGDHGAPGPSKVGLTISTLCCHHHLHHHLQLQPPTPEAMSQIPTVFRGPEYRSTLCWASSPNDG